MSIFLWGRGFQMVSERGTHSDKVRCTSCRRWTRVWVTQGLIDQIDPDSTSRVLCAACAAAHRGFASERLERSMLAAVGGPAA